MATSIRRGNIKGIEIIRERNPYLWGMKIRRRFASNHDVFKSVDNRSYPLSYLESGDDSAITVIYCMGLLYLLFY
jgi:hypothetical protein